MVEEIAAQDAYARHIEAEVLEVTDGGLVLDRTVFYARGGGQPGDQGLIRWPDGEVKVVDTVRRGGVPVHVCQGPAPMPGTEVVAEIDWERRHLLMRTHTALHSLSAIIWREFDAKVTGGNMEPGTARMDFELEGISVEFGQQVEDKLNEELRADHPVEILFLPRDQALADPDLIRTKISLLPDFIDPIRVVHIVGLDKQADGGTHVASTQEVGRVRVVKTESKGKANKRIRIELV
ncbi:MAG: alanyl-tRNA editing protein [Acidimicrobiia bacterium]|nr:alanyl-tRNA editing protein [Acidimicrobiia bacterium]